MKLWRLDPDDNLALGLWTYWRCPSRRLWAGSCWHDHFKSTPWKSVIGKSGQEQRLGGIDHLDFLHFVLHKTSLLLKVLKCHTSDFHGIYKHERNTWPQMEVLVAATICPIQIGPSRGKNLTFLCIYALLIIYSLRICWKTMWCTRNFSWCTSTCHDIPASDDQCFPKIELTTLFICINQCTLAVPCGGTSYFP